MDPAKEPVAFLGIGTMGPSDGDQRLTGRYPDDRVEP